MNKQSGFTLIELVIVIIILGILSATAIPKFLDLQGDARESALSGVKSALEGAATITYSKAAIAGDENEPSVTAENSDSDVALVYGYPAATEDALTTAAQLDDWAFLESGSNVYIYSEDQSSSVATTGDDACSVLYEPATSEARPTITVYSDGC